MFHEIKRPSERIATKANCGSYDPDERAKPSKIDTSRPIDYLTMRYMDTGKSVFEESFDPDQKAEVSFDTSKPLDFTRH